MIPLPHGPSCPVPVRDPMDHLYLMGIYLLGISMMLLVTVGWGWLETKLYPPKKKVKKRGTKSRR